MGDTPRRLISTFMSHTPFYLAHEQEVDANIREGEEGIQRSVPHLSESRPEMYARRAHGSHEIVAEDLAKH